MQGKIYQIVGMSGFIIAGLLFVVAGWRAGDMLVVTGSVIWTFSCIVWMIPLFGGRGD